MPSTASDIDKTVGRRPFLGTLVGTGIVAGRSGMGRFTAASRRDGQSGGGGPTVEWNRGYSGEKREYAFKNIQPSVIVQTTDGGYALGAEGHEISETGESDQYMALIAVTDSGRYQWHTFVKDDQQDSEQTSSDVLQTDEGGFVIAGSRKSPVAQVAKLDPEGNRQWFTELPARETENPEDRQATVKAVVQAVDGGYVLAGTFSHANVRVVKLDEAGNVVWDNRYEGAGSHNELDAFTMVNDGYAFVSRTELVKLDDQGNKQWTADTSVSITVFDLITTADGGFALAGDDRTVQEGESQNFVLVKLDANGATEWHAEYDGPFEGADIAYSVVQTADGGYALEGTMEAAYTGNKAAAVVRTDGDGTERWEKLIEGQDSFARARSLIGTDDGGFAMTNAGGRQRTKSAGCKALALQSGSNPSGTPTAAPTATPTTTATGSATPSATPTTTATDTPTDTPVPTEQVTGTSRTTDSPASTRKRGKTDASSSPESDVSVPGLGILGTVGGLASLAGYLLYRDEADNEP